MFRVFATKTIQAPVTLPSLLRSRFISLTARRACEKKVQPESSPDASSHPPRPTTYLSNFDKKVLIWTKKYKSIDEIPASVANETMDRARNKFRIKVCNYMIVATLIGCIVMIVSGKRAAKRGESVTKYNLDWHKEYNESVAKEKANSGK